MTRVAVLREGKTPADKRVPLSPSQCLQFMANYPEVQLVVQRSPIRCFSDQEYQKLGVQMVDDVSDCDVLLGVKEVPKADLLAHKTYFYFSHTIKKQSYNRELLAKMVQHNISMVDYETLTDSHGRRLIGFGRYAGVVGCYNGFLAYGLRTGAYGLKAAHQCADRKELEKELLKVKLPNVKIILSGAGRVGQGALEIIHALGLKEVSKQEFTSQTFSQPVFVRLDYYDYNETKDGSDFSKSEFFDQPKKFQSSFMQFAKCADIFIAGHYYSSDSPYLFSRKDAKSKDFKIRTIADISCDIDGPVASTLRPSTIADPIYGYNVHTELEDEFNKEDVITVMAVDNLPCELPKDASEDFGNELLKHIFPALLQEDKDKIIERATICKDGDLSPHFEYLRDYLNAN
jgi:saccharopine dehydrogenase (NAD+, L-lysine forming)